VRNVYATQPGSRLEIEAGRLNIAWEDEVLLSVPAAQIENVVLVGRIGVTTPALHFLLERGIGLVLLTASGAFRGRLTNRVAGTSTLRRAQFRVLEDETRQLAVARSIVDGKLGNLRARCLRWNREEPDSAVQRAAQEIQRLRQQIPATANHAALLGIEGRASRRYYDAFRRQVGAPWSFTRRARRPPPDPVNALLSVTYTLLYFNCVSALEAAGLDPAWGFLHQPRDGRASLALDLMEEFRPVIADAVVLTMLNKQMLTPANFDDGDGGVVLDREGWRVLARAYEQRMRTRILAPGSARQTTYQKLLERQARQFRRIVQDEAWVYEPYRTR
jgi:CRISPR-associated protein Cas1